MANPVKQPSTIWPSAGETPPATTSAAEPDMVNIEDQVRLWIAHCMRASYSSFRATIDDESGGKKEGQPQPRRKTKVISSKLRTMDATAVKQVLWPHELVFTSDCHPAA